MKVQGKGVIENVELQLPAFTITTSFLPLELGVASTGPEFSEALYKIRKKINTI